MTLVPQAKRKQRKKRQFSAHTMRINCSIPPDRRITLIIFYRLGFCASKENAVCCDVTVTLNHVWASRRNAGNEWKYGVLTAFIGRLMRVRGTRALHQPGWQPFTHRCPLKERENENDTATAFPMDSCLCFIVVCCLLQMSSVLINVLTEILMLAADTPLIFIQRQPKFMLIFYVLPQI